MQTKISAVLRQAYPALMQLHDDFFIIGTSALNLCGVNLRTADIDILVSDSDAVYLQNVWADRVMKEHVTQRDDLFRSTFARFHFDELDIEIMGELQVNTNGVWTPLHIQDYFVLNLDDMSFKLPTIEEQKRIFHLFGRTKDLEKIRWIEEWQRKNKQFG